MKGSLVVTLASALTVACATGNDEANGTDGDGDGDGDGDRGSGGNGTGGGLELTGGSGSGANPGTGGVGGACESVSEQATAVFKPQDIILLVDNSGSMDDEAQAVQDRINTDLASLLGGSGIDYRVILISRYGTIGESVGSVETGICITTPLGGHDCSNPDETGSGSGQPATGSERFFHVSEDIDSTDALCQVLTKFDDTEHATDQPGASADGWQTHARPEAFKNFVVITDDHVNCSSGGYSFSDGDSVTGGEAAAAQFDAALLALSPDQFGTSDARNYNFHSIVGLAENAPETSPWTANEPIQLGMCSGNGNNVETPGTGYQALSQLTGGLRYPICQWTTFNAVFQEIANGIIEGATLSCEWEIPPPPEGETFDKDKVNLQYTAGDGSQQTFPRVDSLADCPEDGGWYYDDPESPTQVFACPATCDVLESDADGAVDVLFGCQTITVVVR